MSGAGTTQAGQHPHLHLTASLPPRSLHTWAEAAAVAGAGVTTGGGTGAGEGLAGSTTGTMTGTGEAGTRDGEGEGLASTLSVCGWREVEGQHKVGGGQGQSTQQLATVCPSSPCPNTQAQPMPLLTWAAGLAAGSVAP